MRKCISLIICFALLAPFVNMVSYASSSNSEIKEFTVQALQFPEDEAVFVQGSGQPISFYSNPSNPYLFGNLLTPAQRSVYDAIVEQKAGLLTDGAVNVQFPADEDMAATIQTAVAAVIDDYPEFFWVGGYGVKGTQNKDFFNLTISLSLDTNSYANWDVLRENYYALLSAVESFEVKGNTRYAKLKSIHDQICKMTTYKQFADPDPTEPESEQKPEPMAHHPTGVFLKGKAVCEGYAEALKLLCDREGIPCIIVVGTGNGGPHEWNYVQMEDGKWYGMDVTWDDQDKQNLIFYDYFLVGAKSMINKAFGENRKFGDGTDSDTDGGDHINSGAHFQNTSFPLTYPAISEQSYAGVIPLWNSSASFDNTRSLMFIPKNAVARQQLLCTYTAYSNYNPSTNSATVSGVTTGGTVKITSPVSRTYTIVRRGDVDKNNAVNAADYEQVLNIVMCQQAEYSNAAQFAAADMNGDGVIDGFDAIYLDLYYNGVVD